MKKRTGILAILMASVMCFGLFAGCGGDDGLDPNKTTIVVGYQDGGFRDNWLLAWEADFAKMFKDKSFEPGKTGVQFDNQPTKALAQTPAQTIEENDYDIIFNEQENHTYFFIDNDIAKNVSDLVTTPLTEFGETKSIVDKLSLDDREFFGNGKTYNETTGQYDYADNFYTLPWFETIMGIYYDVDLFEQKGYFIAAPASEGGNPDSYGCVRSKSAPRSNGPDGKTGNIDGVDYSCDDGLPATYEEFFRMCDKIFSQNQTAILWSGAQANYMPFFFQTIAADFDGYEQTKLKFTLDGTARNLISVANDGTVTELPDEVITSATGYHLIKQEGNYRALQFLERLINTPNPNDSTRRKYLNQDESFGTSTTAKAAQGIFVGSKYQALEGNHEAVAMFVDGSWWYNEATSDFNAYSSFEGAGQRERRIGLMPIPKYDNTRLGEATYLKTWITNVMINKEADSKPYSEAVDLFFRYCHTDKALSAFTRETHALRPFNYNLTAEDEQKASYFAKDLLRIHNTQKIVNPYSLNNVVKNNTSKINANYTNKYGNEPQKILFGKSADSIQLFKAFSEYLTASQWADLYGAYY